MAEADGTERGELRALKALWETLTGAERSVIWEIILGGCCFGEKGEKDEEELTSNND